MKLQVKQSPFAARRKSLLVKCMEGVNKGKHGVCPKPKTEKVSKQRSGQDELVLPEVGQSEIQLSQSEQEEKAKEEYRTMGTRSPAFKAWFGDWENDPENASKAVKKDGSPDESVPYSQVVDEEGNPQIVFHGTTHQFDAFDLSKANEINHLGKGFYFSSARTDSDRNYGGVGPDLRNRVSGRSEQIQGDLANGAYEDYMTEEEYEQYKEDMDNPDYESDWRDIADDLAQSELVGEDPHVEQVYLNIRNPMVLGVDKGATVFSMEYPTITNEDGDEEPDYNAEPTGNGAKFIDALRMYAEDYTKEGMDPIDVDKILEDIGFPDVFMDGIKSEKLLREFFNSEEVIYVGKEDSNTGQFEFLSGQLLNDVFRKMGYDGVIYQDARKWFPSMGIPKGTKHYIAFDPKQIKSVDNQGTFDPTTDKIHKSLEPSDPVQDLANAGLQWDLPSADTIRPVEDRLLPLPDIRQRDDFSCGSAATMSAARYWGKGPEKLDEWKEALHTTEEDSTLPANIVEYLTSLGLEVEERQGMTLEELRQCWREGKPVIVPLQEYGTPGKEASRKYGHYVVVIGHGFGCVIVQDPSFSNVIEQEKHPPEHDLPEELVEQALEYLKIPV